MITVASTTESPEQIKADLASAGFNVTSETTDVTGKPGETNTSTQSADAPQGAPAADGETAAALEAAPTHEQTGPDTNPGRLDKITKKLLKRVDKTTANWRSEESRRKQLESENDELRRKLAEANPAGKPAAAATEATPPATEVPAEAAEPAATAEIQASERPKRPRQNDFADWDEYETALDKYDKDLDAYHATVAQAQVQNQQQEQAQATRWNEIASEGQKRFPDWNEVRPQEGTEKDVRFAPEIASLIQVSAVAPDVLHHLALNPQDARYLANLPVPVAARELGRLEAHLERATPTNRQAAAAAPPAETASREAPRTRTAPINPANTANGAVGAPSDLAAGITPREYRRRRAAGEIR